MSATKGNTVDKATEAPKTKAKAPELDATKDYTLIGTGTSKAFKKGWEGSASGADAMALIESGKATLKADK